MVSGVRRKVSARSARCPRLPSAFRRLGPDSLWTTRTPTTSPPMANSTDMKAENHDPDAHTDRGTPTPSMQTMMMALAWRGDRPQRALI